MVLQPFPGVHVIEAPSDVHTIVGVATSITAFVGRTKRGPVKDPVLIHSFTEYRDRFGGLWEASPLSYAVQQYFLNGGRDAVIVRVFEKDAEGKGCAALVRKSSSGSEPSTAAEKDEFGFRAATAGTWGNDLHVKLTLVKAPGSKEGELPEREVRTYTLSVRVVSGDKTLEEEVYRNVSANPSHPNYLPEVVRTSKLIALSDPEAAIPDFGEEAEYAPVKNDKLDGAEPGDNEVLLGLELLRRVDLFNLLCVPPYSFAKGREPSKNTLDEAAKLCADRRAILIVDPPARWGTKDDVLKDYSKAVPIVDNAVIYFPRVMAPDGLSAQRREDFAPCGVMAGVIARTDALRGVWKAPAGIGPEATLRVDGLAYNLTDPECGELNQKGINCLRTFAATGPVAWGARTLRGGDELADPWKYLPVRRLAYFIEESLYRGLKWAVFEPNDERLWSQLRLNVTSFIHDLFRQGAFQGTSARDAYLVRCDAETTTQSDINRGIVNVIVGFAPLKPAEFVVLRLQQLAGQVQV